MKIADGVFLERLLGLGVSGFRQAGDTVALQTTMQGGPRQMGQARLQGIPMQMLD